MQPAYRHSDHDRQEGEVPCQLTSILSSLIPHPSSLPREETCRWPATPTCSHSSRRCSTRVGPRNKCAATVRSCFPKSGGGGRLSASLTGHSRRCFQTRRHPRVPTRSWL